MRAIPAIYSLKPETKDMKETDKNINQTEVRIYQSVGKNLLLFAGCLVFVVIGCMIVRDEYCGLAKKIFVGWLGILFFGGGGLSVFAVVLYNRIRHIPLLKIFDNRIELYKQYKGVYYSIDFSDVRKFRFVKNRNFKTIAVDYKTISLKRKLEESPGFMQSLMSFNFKETGAIENIPAGNLTMKGKDICDLLNARLKCFRNKKEESK